MEQKVDGFGTDREQQMTEKVDEDYRTLLGTITCGRSSGKI